MKNSKLGNTALLSIAFMLVLSGLGVSYAAWTETITIQGTVNTGELCWEFADCDTLDHHQPINQGGDYPTDFPDYTCNDGFVFEPGEGWFWALDKDVSWCEQELVDLDEDGHMESVDLTIFNTYPGNFHEVTFYVNNCGTIPLRFNRVLLSDGVHEWVINGFGSHVEMDFNDDGEAEFEILWNEPCGQQIHPGGFSPEFSFWMHCLSPMDQSDVCEFTVSPEAVQWDEYPHQP